ncbi:serine hydrolase domain-containing protein [Bradyrhizobium prioriisuperbiae]|uniref:serine hydrolase domain-containing protein n=1 Tax=Bradyrhizobium prioriisuperbiae TaxID=2854389 RepID=UPI0028EBFC42|nr:serine hydrolase domain-containing protein [Bradyrhizobium prioritasuperba]
MLSFALFSAVVGFTAAAEASDLKLSPSRLDRITSFFNNEVASKKIPGAIVLIQRHGRPAYFKTFGVRDVMTMRPMTSDTIFRLYSMSKPITAVAAMTLVEEGKLSLTDPVSKYIPSFADMKVGVARDVPGGKPVLDLVPAERPITIQDLLRHTSGLVYDYVVFDPLKQVHIDANVLAGDFDNAEFADRLAKLPLAYQPGTTWAYGYSFDVLARVIEVVSGKSLRQFEYEHLFGPLGMTGTGFYVTRPDQQDKVAEPLPSDPVRENPRIRKRWESGGSGMVSTTADLARFFQMLLNGGMLEGKRFLSPKTVELMLADSIGPAAGVKPWLYYYPGAGFGFGLGFAVRTEAGVSPWAGSIGQVDWGGAAGTYFWIDREEDMLVLLMVQTPTERGRIESALKNLVYGAFEK